MPYTLQTDWSAKGMGAILSQIGKDGEEGVIAYASRSNNKGESNYSSYHGELLAAVWGVQHCSDEGSSASVMAHDEREADREACSLGLDFAGIRVQGGVQAKICQWKRRCLVSQSLA